MEARTSTRRLAPLLLGLVFLAGLAVYPPWVARSEASRIELGHAWLWNPPARLGPEAFEGLEMGADATDADRARMQQHVADAFGDPEIDRWPYGFHLTVGALLVCAGLLATRKDRRPARKRAP